MLDKSLALLVQAIALSFANYLLVLYLTDTTVEGPFGIFDWVRKKAGIKPVSMYNLETGQEEEHLAVEDRFWAKVLDCHRCLSPYGAFLLVALSWITGLSLIDWTAIVLWVTVSGITVLIFELLNR